MNDLVNSVVNCLSEGTPTITRESMATPGGDGEGSMNGDKPCDIGTKTGKSKQPDATGKAGNKKPKTVKDITPK